MPIHSLQAGPLEIQYRFRGYLYLLTGSVDCAKEALVLGNGPKQFDTACDITTMGTGGGWSSSRSAHTEYGALLAERGLLGVFATLCLVAALWAGHRRNQPHENTLWSRLESGVIMAYLVAAFAGPIWYQMGFAALVGVWSRNPE
jgi:O-antigen ligase